MVGWRRALAVLGMAAAGVLLSGCHLQGSAQVISPDEASLDLLVSDYEFDCTSSDDPTATVRLEPGPDVDGSPSCHVTGTVPLSNLGFADLHTDEFGEYWAFSGTFADGHTSWVDADIEVHFPGDVVEANQGTIQGNTLRINPAKLTDDLRVVVRNRPGPATWVIAAVSGVAAGVALALTVLWLFRRARRQGAPVNEAAGVVGLAAEGQGDGSRAAGAQGVPDVTAQAQVSGVPDVTAQAQVSGAPSVTAQAPASTAEAPAPFPTVEVDHAWFATPPEALPESPEDGSGGGDPPQRATPDHSMWARPPDR